MVNNEVTILLVEDDAGHAGLIKRNLKRAKITNDVVWLEDGQSAVDYLMNEGDYADAAHPSPLLVLLDLNLPSLNGFQVLERMKSSEVTRHIPVIILTTTEDSVEVHKCYELGANVYITKPVDYDDFSEAIRRLGLFLAVVTIPDGE